MNSQYFIVKDRKITIGKWLIIPVNGFYTSNFVRIKSTGYVKVILILSVK